MTKSKEDVKKVRKVKKVKKDSSKSNSEVLESFFKGVIIILLFLIFISGGNPVSYVVNDNLSVVMIDPIDDESGAVMSITFEHHEIHEGNHYFINGFQTIDDGENITFGVTTYNSDLMSHVTTTISGTSQVEIYIYENVSFTGGVPVVPFNNDRNSNHTSNTTLSLAPTIIDNGYLISSQSSGKAGANPQKSTGGLSSRESEIILKQNTSYIFTTISRDNDNIIDYRAEWYEHRGGS